MAYKTKNLIPGAIYHIYNRANGHDVMFVSDLHYRAFLESFKLRLENSIEVLCYCLMPNHFHLMVKVKMQLRPGQIEYSQGLNQRFSNFFNAYAKLFNFLTDRKGSLFMQNYNRKLVTDREYLAKLIDYIHENPVKSNLCKQPEQWPYSSAYGIRYPEKAFFETTGLINLIEENSLLS